MKIFSNQDELLLNVEVDDSSYRHRVIKGEHNIVLKYSLSEHVELPVGSYCIFQGQRYTLENPEAFKKQHNRRFDYTVTFESYQAKAKIWKFRNPVDGRLKFSLTAKPREHLQMFVDNMNRRDTGWTVGDCIDGVETLINYDHDFCLDALIRQASEFKTEYEIEGKRVSLKKVEYNKSNPLPLSYGYGNGFKSGVGRSSRRLKSCSFREARTISTGASTGTENSSSRKNRQSDTTESISRTKTVSLLPTPEPMSWTIWVSQSVEPTNSHSRSQKTVSTPRRYIRKGSERLRPSCLSVWRQISMISSIRKSPRISITRTV